MRARVLAFASLRDILGAEQSLEMAGPTPLSALLERMAAEHPALWPRLPFLRYAANATLVDSGYVVQDGDEIALMPPTSGG
ncbi:MAG: MoaD/ThiS family protein [Candidatus Xenobia bacterium]